MQVSIITPTYNHEKFLADCIQSVIDQTYQDWEMIIVDDGSTDGTAKIAQYYVERDNRIRYFYQDNVGLNNLAITYNRALQESKGELIAILEGDDYWCPNKLELQTEVFKTNGSVIFCWGRVDEVYEDKTKFGSYPIKYNLEVLPYYNNKSKASIINVVFDEFPIPLTWVIRKSVLDEIGGFLQSKEIPTVDRDTLYELSLHGEFKYINDTIGAYRRPIYQATKRLTVQITKGCCSVIQSFYKRLPDEVKANINFDQKYIDQTCNEMMVKAYSKYGRACLIRKEFKEARRSYMESLKGNIFFLPIWKLRSLVGIVFSFLRMDLEGFVNLLGRKTYYK